MVACAALLVGGDSDVVRKKVSNGVEQFNKNNFNGAAKAFADAEMLTPDNLTIKFNRACAEARIQNRKDALTLFRAAAASSDPKLAAAAQYNLGSLEALEARGIFGESPGDVSGVKRETGIEHLANAVRHFRNCLNADPTNADARRNIEIIRVWQAKMRKIWKQKDEEEKKKKEQGEAEEPLVRFLARLDRAQHKAFARNGARRARPAKESLLAMQNKVNEMLPELQGKIEKELTPQEGATEEQQASLAQAREVFGQLSAKLSDSTKTATNAIEDEQREASVAAQVDALDRVNEMHNLVSGFPDAVMHALRLQAKLAETGVHLGNPQELQISEGNTWLERQSRVGAIASQLSGKAERFREVLEQQAEQNNAAAPPGSSAPPQDSDAQQQIAGYQTAIERAIELSPRLIEVVESASKHLLPGNISEATPDMREAFEILKKIAETLPKQDDGGGGGDDEDKDDQQEDEKNNESGPQTGGDDDEKQEPKESDGEQEQMQQEQQIRDREQAETLMRQVRDREQSLKDMKAQLRAMRARRSRVERDW